MYSQNIGENPTIALRSNWLAVDGNTLRADALRDPDSEKLTVSAEQLGSVLLLGRRAILQGIEEFYDQQIEKHPDSTIVRTPVWTAQLGTAAQTSGRHSQVFTDVGYANGGVNTSIDEIKHEFHDYWNAVREAGFIPEVRRTSGSRDGGSWLLLRKPSLPDVLHHWFDYKEGSVDTALEAIVDEDKETERRNLHRQRILGEQAVDQASNTLRPRRQIGLILSMAAIKSALEDRDGYQEEVDDALLYADNDPSIDESTIRAIENSMFEISQ